MAIVPRSGYDPRLSRVHGTLRFDVPDVGSWRLRLDGGHFELLVGPGDADLVMSCSEETFVALLEGKQNFVAGILRGRIRAEGNLALALKFHGVFSSHVPAAFSHQPSP